MNMTIWTDGGCHGNPGPGGWAFVIARGAEVVAEERGGEKLTTNNRMELVAVINALEFLPRLPEPAAPEARLEIRTDSQYVQKGITEWIHKWKRSGWRTTGKTPVKNVDLWQKLDALCARRALAWRWVKGHAGTAFNERCDGLVQQAIAEL